MSQDGDITQGALRFAGGQRRASHWARLSSDTEPHHLSDLLTLDWHASLPAPHALLSVVGGACTEGARRDFVELPAHTEVEFSRGFARAAQATHAWVLTGAISAGATRLVGGALKEAPDVSCVGVAPWSVVEKGNRDSLMRHAGRGVCALTTGQPESLAGAAGYHDRVLPYAAAVASNKALEPRVSHFLLTDSRQDAMPW